MRTMAMQGRKLNRPEHCQGLAETGLIRAKGKVDIQTEALFRIIHAPTLAKTGRRPTALAEAEAEMQLKQGRIEQSCATWNRSIHHMAGVHSVRTREAVQNLWRSLRRFRARGIRPAVELTERATLFLADV